jgi:molybdenum cofactor cytidylyltransferase
LAQPSEIAAILLAAGASRRMRGENKLLAEIGGKPLVAHAADALLAGGLHSVVVVTGNESDRVREALAGRALRFAHQPDWALGMASSLRAGVEALPPGIAGALIALGDMPAVSPNTVRALSTALDSATGHSIAVPVTDRARGHPVLFAAAHFDELRALQGDTGARALLERHAARVCRVAVDDAGILLDIDTPEALAALRAERGTR